MSLGLRLLWAETWETCGWSFHLLLFCIGSQKGLFCKVHQSKTKASPKQNTVWMRYGYDMAAIWLRYFYGKVFFVF